MRSLVLALALTTAAGQSGVATVAGTWTADFAGRTFVRLNLNDKGGTITGAMSLGDVEFDKQGAVSRAEPAPPDLKPISDVTRRGATLTFSRKDETDVDRFEVRFLEKGRAELRLLLTDADRKELAAMGIPVLKPIALTKQ